MSSLSKASSHSTAASPAFLKCIQYLANKSEDELEMLGDVLKTNTIPQIASAVSQAKAPAQLTSVPSVPTIQTSFQMCQLLLADPRFKHDDGVYCTKHQAKDIAQWSQTRLTDGRHAYRVAGLTLAPAHDSTAVESYNLAGDLSDEIARSMMYRTDKSVTDYSDRYLARLLTDGMKAKRRHQENPTDFKLPQIWY